MPYINLRNGLYVHCAPTGHGIAPALDKNPLSEEEKAAIRNRPIYQGNDIKLIHYNVYYRLWVRVLTIFKNDLALQEQGSRNFWPCIQKCLEQYDYILEQLGVDRDLDIMKRIEKLFIKKRELRRIKTQLPD